MLPQGRGGGVRALGFGMMLAFVVVLSSLAAATPPKMPPTWSDAEVRAEPGSVVVSLVVHEHVPTPVRLRAPDWIRVESLGEEPLAEGVRASWRMTPTREGFWAATVAPAGDAVQPWCCAYASETDGQTRAGLEMEDVVPPVTVHATLTGTPEPDGWVQLRYETRAQAPWLEEANLTASIAQSATYLCDTCARLMPQAEHVATGPATGPVEAHGDFDLTQRGDAFTLAVQLEMRFDGAPYPYQKEIVCENARVALENGTLRRTETWSCDTPSKEWRHVAGLRRDVPALPAGAVLALVAAGAALRRR